VPDLAGADLTGADLSKANFNSADFTGANLAGADFNSTIVGQTTFATNDLSTVKGLDTVIHQGPSTIGVDTIYLSTGNIPKIFLRGVGLPDDLITFVRARKVQLVEFYFCHSQSAHSSRRELPCNQLPSQTELCRSGANMC
jgi:uncharacterized protein YjbI with pentapeptide repeats